MASNGRKRYSNFLRKQHDFRAYHTRSNEARMVFLKDKILFCTRRSIHGSVASASPISNVQTEYPFALLATGRDFSAEQTVGLTSNICEIFE